jgi:hypothetical protein
MTERRGGFRLNPIAVVADSLDKRAPRRTATGLRGTHVSHDGLIDDWHEVGDSGEPAFENSWVNKGGTNETAAFRKDGEGTVFLKGVITAGTINTAAFTLPAGYRPALGKKFGAWSRSASAAVIAQLNIDGNGVVNPRAGNNDRFSVACSFPAEQ